MQVSDMFIRPIQSGDNAAIAKIIRTSLAEFGANHCGTVYFDEATDNLSELFSTPGSYYFIVETEGKVAGGAGIYPTKGLPADTCELVKMYLSASVRGKGMGRKLLQLCIDTAKNQGYGKIYLETMPELVKAVPVYEKFGFKYLDGPLGNSGHFGCVIHMLKEL